MEKQNIQSFINKVICGECISVMKGIPYKSVDCIVTSPPYYKQLSYESNFNSYLQYIEFITKKAKECKFLCDSSQYVSASTKNSIIYCGICYPYPLIFFQI